MKVPGFVELTVIQDSGFKRESATRYIRVEDIISFGESFEYYSGSEIRIMQRDDICEKTILAKEDPLTIAERVKEAME